VADIIRGENYTQGLCTLADKIHRGLVAQFGGDPELLSDLAGLLGGLGHEALARQLEKAIRDYHDAEVISVELGDGPPIICKLR